MSAPISQSVRALRRLNPKVSKPAIVVWKWEKISVEEFRDCIFGHSICNVGEDLYILGGKRRGAFTSDLIKLRASDLSHVEI
jgi:hypothetical protein